MFDFFDQAKNRVSKLIQIFIPNFNCKLIPIIYDFILNVEHKQCILIVNLYYLSKYYL